MPVSVMEDFSRCDPLPTSAEEGSESADLLYPVPGAANLEENRKRFDLFASRGISEADNDYIREGVIPESDHF